MNKTTMRSVGLLVGRIALGVIFLAHGWQKVVTNGLDATAKGFTAMGAPMPAVSAFLAGWGELLGGIALIVGALTPLVGTLLALDMLGAYLIAHAGKGLFATEGGYELVLALGAGALMIALVGAGKFSVDALLGRKVKVLAQDEPLPSPA